MTAEKPTRSAPRARAPKIAPDSPDRFISRELSWIAFNMRVLEEARNLRNPLLERVRFLSISASNWDEFYMVRVAGLKAQIDAGVTAPGQDGRTPAQTLAEVLRLGTELMAEQRALWRELREELRGQGIAVIGEAELTDDDRGWLERHFLDHVFPVLTPLSVNPANPVPSTTRPLQR